jgi:DNA invertase Pin-like site-specific DNA recombinase
MLDHAQRSSMFNLLGSIAQVERELTRQRMLVGIAKAKAEGKYKAGRQRHGAKAAEVRRLHHEGFGATKIGRRLKISRASGS